MDSAHTQGSVIAAGADVSPSVVSGMFLTDIDTPLSCGNCFVNTHSFVRRLIGRCIRVGFL